MSSYSSVSSLEWEAEHEDGAEALSLSTPSKHLYSVLGIDIMATQESIKGAYRRLARLWHPDRHGGKEESVRRFQQIQNAYEVLSDSERRMEYDSGLLERLDVEEYLGLFQGFILTVSGLGMSSRRSSYALQEEQSKPLLAPPLLSLLTAA